MHLVLERAPASLVEALGVLAEMQILTSELTIEAWASDANRHPEELGGTLTVETLPEGGTRVLSRLPLSQRAEE